MAVFATEKGRIGHTTRAALLSLSLLLCGGAFDAAQAQGDDGSDGIERPNPDEFDFVGKSGVETRLQALDPGLLGDRIDPNTGADEVGNKVAKPSLFNDASSNLNYI